MENLNNKHFLTVKDHSVSKENFELYRDEHLDMLFTKPKPNAIDLPKYYESDDYISHTDGKRSFFEHFYHFIKNIALKHKLRLINSLCNERGKILDIGAGTGDLLLVAKKNGWETIGYEPNAKARKIAENKGIKFTSETSNLENASFDIITMWHVLEHVSDVEAQIKELKRLIKPTGAILIAVPNFNSYDALYYKEFWAAFDVPRHLSHFSKKSIALLFEVQNLKLAKILPMKFDAYYVSLLSEKYKTGRMNYAKAFAIGLKSNFIGRGFTEYSSHIYILKNK